LATSSSGWSCGFCRFWILNTTGASPFYPAPGTLLALARLSGRQFQFFLSGSFGVNYVIQANTNLSTRNWVMLFTNTVPFTFTDPNASNYARRFYRAVYFP
jgi:hypothetical protein